MTQVRRWRFEVLATGLTLTSLGVVPMLLYATSHRTLAKAGASTGHPTVFMVAILGIVPFAWGIGLITLSLIAHFRGRASRSRSIPSTVTERPPVPLREPPISPIPITSRHEDSAVARSPVPRGYWAPMVHAGMPPGRRRLPHHGLRRPAIPTSLCRAMNRIHPAAVDPESGVPETDPNGASPSVQAREPPHGQGRIRGK